MKLKQLSKQYPVIAAILVVVIIAVLTELPVKPLRDALAPLVGRFSGDYLADLILNAAGALGLLLVAAPLGLGGKLGLKAPRPWHAALLGWPLLLLAIPDGGETELVFRPGLLILLVALYFFIGFFEELLFRGFVQGFLARKWGHNYRGLLGVVLLANLIFAGAHLTNLVMGRATLLYAIGQFGYAFFFGVFFSALYVRSGSLWPGIGLHMLYDFMANLDAFAPDALPRSQMVRDNSFQGLLIALLFTLPLLLIGLFYLRKSKLSFLHDEARAA
jgi:membrane protease YdiL (CAAX protease family)